MTEQTQKAADEFHMMIGYCIAEWARIDEELFRLFQACLGASIRQCAIIYYRMPGINQRLDVVDELIKSVLPKHQSGMQPHAYVKKWTAIYKRCDDLLGTRRRIAHQPVQPKYEMKLYRSPRPNYFDQQFPAETLQQSFEIYVSQNEQSRGKGELSPLTTTELQSHLLETAKIQSSMRDYLHGTLGPVLAHVRQATQHGKDIDQGMGL
jgi:hypothetical protein